MNDEEYEVEAILDHKIADDGTDMYLVRWKGYSDADNTWECYQTNPDLKEKCSRAIANYHKNIKLKRQQYKIDLSKIKTGTKSFIPISKKYQKIQKKHEQESKNSIMRILSNSESSDSDGDEKTNKQNKTKKLSKEIQQEIESEKEEEEDDYEIQIIESDESDDEYQDIQPPKINDIKKFTKTARIIIDENKPKIQNTNKYQSSSSSDVIILNYDDDGDYQPEPPKNSDKERIKINRSEIVDNKNDIITSKTNQSSESSKLNLTNYSSETEAISTTTTTTQNSTEHSDDSVSFVIPDIVDSDSDYDSQIGSPISDLPIKNSLFGSDIQMLMQYPPELIYSCKKVFGIVRYYIHSEKKNYSVCSDALKTYNPDLILRFLESHIIIR